MCALYVYGNESCTIGKRGIEVKKNRKIVGLCIDWNVFDIGMEVIRMFSSIQIT